MSSFGQHKIKDDTTQIPGPPMSHHLHGADTHTAGKCQPKQKKCVVIKPHRTVIIGFKEVISIYKRNWKSTVFIHIRIHDCTISLKEDVWTKKLHHFLTNSNSLFKSNTA
jgi:hypothetical protein